MPRFDLSYSRCCLLFLLMSTGVLAQDARYWTTSGVSAPSSSNFRRRAYHASIVFNDYLYVDGGQVWQLVDGNLYYANNNNTVSIDLTVPWTNSTVRLTTINKTAPAWNRGYLWPDASNTSFYQWGGELSYLSVDPQLLPPSQLWELLPDGHGGGQWTQPGLTPNSNFGAQTRGLQGADAIGGDTWYLLGGYAVCHSSQSTPCGDQFSIDGMTSFNSSSGQWTVQSAEQFSPANTTIASRMENVPFGGDAGLNVILGGGIPPTQNFSDNDVLNYLGFDRVYIHDPTTNQFYNQTTTGANPTPREAFCIVGTSGSNGSYEIFVFGGHNFAATGGLLSDEVFVLSLPGFVWFQASLPAASSRALHTCNLAGKGRSQMVVVGGIDLTQPNDTARGEADPWTNGINVMDLHAMQWKSSFDPDDSDFQSPTVVTDWYKTNNRYPSNMDPAVKNLFMTSSSPTVTSTSTAQSTASSAPGSSSNKSHTNIGAIVGGVVGGLAIIGVVLAFVLLRLRRRRRTGAQAPDHSKNGYSDKPKLGMEYTDRRAEVGDSGHSGELENTEIYERPLSDRHSQRGRDQPYEMYAPIGQS